MNNKKSYTMQYPYDPSNPLYDGMVHEIIPHFFRPVYINDRLFYVMDYYDVTLGLKLITLIGNINGKYYKFPLTEEEYRVLQNFLINNPDIKQLTPMEVEINGNIGLAETVGVAVGEKLNLLPKLQAKSPVEKEYEMIYYIPLKNDRQSNTRSFSKNGVFKSGGLTKQPYDSMQAYSFLKTPMCNEFATMLLDKNNYRAKSIKKHYYNDDGVQKAEFTVLLHRGSTVTKSFVEKNGKKKSYQVILPPGTYNITVYFSDFVDEEDFNNSLHCNKIIVFADSKEYKNDLHDTPIVFKDAGTKILDMTFDKEVLDYSKKR